MGRFSMRILFFLFFLGFSHLFALGADSLRLPQVAVIPVSGDEELTVQQLSFLTGQLSAELVKTKAFTVLDRSQMDFILKEQGFQQSGICNTSECQVQMGQLLGVEYIVVGSLVRFGSKYALRADYIEVSNGKVTQSVDQDETGELEDVYKELCQGVGQKLAKAVRVKKKKEQVVTPENSAIVVPEPAALALESQPESVSYVSTQISDTPSAPLSTKRKVALALWGTSLLGAGVGRYFDSQGFTAAEDYDAALLALHLNDARNAYDRIGTAETGRKASYGVSVSALVVGSVLWFWPEGK